MSSTEGNPWRRVSRRVAYENPWIEILHDEVVRPDGQPGIYGVVHFRHLAIGVVPIDASDRVLLVGQFRYTMNHYSWEIPEGGGDFDEIPEAAARRELAEETGFIGGEWREICRAELSNSVTDEVTILFVATGLEAGPASPGGHRAAPAALGSIRRGHGHDLRRRDRRRDDDPGHAAAGPGAGGRAALRAALRPAPPRTAVRGPTQTRTDPAPRPAPGRPARRVGERPRVNHAPFARGRCMIPWHSQCIGFMR